MTELTIYAYTHNYARNAVADIKAHMHTVFVFNNVATEKQKQKQQQEVEREKTMNRNKNTKIKHSYKNEALNVDFNGY